MSWTQWARESCEDWCSLGLCLSPQSMDKDNRVHNYWFSDILYVARSEEDSCNQNSNPCTPPFLMSSTHHHYFHRPLIPENDLTTRPYVLFFTTKTLLFHCTKMKFSIEDFFSKYDQIHTADLVTFIEEILNGKLHFLCSVLSIFCLSIFAYLVFGA